MSCRDDFEDLLRKRAMKGEALPRMRKGEFARGVHRGVRAAGAEGEGGGEDDEVEVHGGQMELEEEPDLTETDASVQSVGGMYGLAPRTDAVRKLYGSAARGDVGGGGARAKADNPFIFAPAGDGEGGAKTSGVGVDDGEYTGENRIEMDAARASTRALGKIIKDERLRYEALNYSVTPGPPAGVDPDRMLEWEAFGNQRDLWEAARSGNTGAISVAVQSGANVNLPDKGFHEWTALHRS